MIKKLVQELLMRTIELSVYECLLKYGYIPNRVTYANDPTGYANKEAEIRKIKNFCVSLFGHGSPGDKDLKTMPKVSIMGLGFFKGSIGSDPLPYYSPNLQGSFDKLLAPLRSSQYRFEIELNSNKVEQDHVLEHVRAESLPDFAHLPLVDVPDSYILLSYTGTRSIPDMAHGLTKKIYTYDILDIFETFSRLEGVVSKIKEIRVEDTDPSDNLVVNVP